MRILVLPRRAWLQRETDTKKSSHVSYYIVSCATIRRMLYIVCTSCIIPEHKNHIFTAVSAMHAVSCIVHIYRSFTNTSIRTNYTTYVIVCTVALLAFAV